MRHDERCVVVERSWIKQRYAERHAKARLGRDIDGGRRVVEDHLRPSGRTAAGHGLPVARHRIVQRFVGHAFRDEADRHGIGSIPVGFAANDQRWLENVQHGGRFAARQPRRQRGRRRTKFPYRKAGLEKGVAVRQADGDEIAGLDALGGKRVGAPVRPSFELLPGQRLSAVTDRNRIPRFTFGIPARHIGDRDQHGGVSLARRLAAALIEPWRTRSPHQALHQQVRY